MRLSGSAGNRMSEQDYITIYWEGQSMGVGALTLYLTIVSGYLIVSFTASTRLTTAQSIFVATLFIVFSSFSCWGVFEYWSSAFQAAQAVKEHFVFNRLGVNPATFAVPMMILGIIGSLNFAWNIRRTN